LSSRKNPKNTKNQKEFLKNLDILSADLVKATDDKKLLILRPAVSKHDLIALLLCGSACFIAVGTVPAFLRPEARAKVSERTLTFAERGVPVCDRRDLLASPDLAEGQSGA
jgi:hypothetical protein